MQGVACFSCIQVLIIGIPVIFLTLNQSVASYFTQTTIVFLVCVSMLLLIFLPKMKLVREREKAGLHQSYRGSSRTRTARTSTLQQIDSVNRRGSIFIQTEEDSQAMKKRYQFRIRELEVLLEEAKAANSLPAQKAKVEGNEKSDCESDIVFAAIDVEEQDELETGIRRLTIKHLPSNLDGSDYSRRQTGEEDGR